MLKKEEQELLKKLEEREARRKEYHKEYNKRKTVEQKEKEKEYHRNYNKRMKEELERLRRLSKSS